MKILALSRYALGACAAALLAACSSGGAQLAPPAAMQQSLGYTMPTSARTNHDASRFGPYFHIEKELLYISDPGTDDVYVDTYPRHKYVETLTGFYPPLGMCSDSKGNVWIANPNYANLVKYAHGGKRIIATLNDPNQYPVGCAIDTTTGDLAAVNSTSSSGGPGSVSIYRKAAGNATVIGAFSQTYFDGYDNKGYLFVDGVDASFGFQLGVVAKGGKVLNQLTVSGGTINYPGGIQYAFGSLAVGDQSMSGDHSGIYQITVSGSTAKIIGVTQLLSSQRVGPFLILKNTHRVICGDTYYGYVLIYNYPGGGTPVKTLRLLPSGTLAGLALSVPTPTPGP